jgi:hypothetical protein
MLIVIMPIVKVVNITIACQFDLCVYFIVIETLGHRKFIYFFIHFFVSKTRVVGEYPRSTSGFVSSETSGRERSLSPCPSEPGRGGRGSHEPPAL